MFNFNGGGSNPYCISFVLYTAFNYHGPLTHLQTNRKLLMAQGVLG